MAPYSLNRIFISKLRLKIFRCLTLVLVSTCIQLKAQNIGIESLTIADGLSQGMIYDIEQTNDGFLWFATKDGLNRYDGYSFKVYTNDPFNPYSIIGNEVTMLFEDSRGNLWIVVPGKGIDVLEKATGRFLHLPLNVDSDQPGKLNVNCFLESPDSTIWIGTEYGLLATRWTIGSQSIAVDSDLRSSATVTLETKGDKPGVESFYTLSLSADRMQLLSFRDDGIYRYNPTTKVLSQVIKTKSYSKGRFSSRGETAWLWTTFNKNDESVMIFENKIVKDFPNWDKKTNAFNTMATDKEGIDIWSSRIGNESGIYSLPDQELFLPGVSLHPTLICTLKDNVTSLEIDHAGNLWVGTGGYGLRKIRLNHQPFDHFLKGNSVRRIFATDSLYMWLGGSALIWQLDDHQNLATPVHDLPRNVVQYYQTRRGGAYMITIDSLHYYLKNSTSPLPPPKHVDFGSHDFTCIIEDRDGNIWSGGFDAGLMRFEIATSMYSFFDISKQFGKTASVYALHLDPEGNLWVGTTNGMAQIKIKGLQFQTGKVQLPDNAITYYQTDPENPTSLRYNFVSSFCDDPHFPDRYIWVSTKGGGLSLLDKTTKTFRHFNAHNSGLPNDVVYAMLPDDL
ncbi:MAG: two-component regulator propeller domain-containing protein, partial [Saprospiraceae bacterium]